MNLLTDKISIVTGGSRGIGKSIVYKLAQHGSNVIFTYLSSEAKAKSVVKEAEKYGTKVVAIKSDASNYQACEMLVNTVIEKYGRIDILVNNAGITKDNL